MSQICASLRARQAPSQSWEPGKISVSGDPDATVFNGVGREKRVLHQVPLRFSLLAKSKWHCQHTLRCREHLEPRGTLQRICEIDDRHQRRRLDENAWARSNPGDTHENGWEQSDRLSICPHSFEPIVHGLVLR